MRKIDILYKEDLINKFYDIHEFCKAAVVEDNYVGIKRNMDYIFWHKNKHSLLYQIYIAKKYECIMVAYDKNKIIAISGIELYNEDVAIILKRLYVLKNFRKNKEMFLPLQIDWCKEHNIKMAMITINNYNKKMKSMMDRFITDPSTRKRYPIISKFKYHGKMKINSIKQDVYYFKLEEKYDF